MPCATADGESGSDKTWILCVGSTPLNVSVTKENALRKPFEIKPCMCQKLALLQINLNHTLVESYAYSCCIPLRGWGWTCGVLLYSPLFCCFRGGSGLRCRGSRVGGCVCTQRCLRCWPFCRMLPLTHSSDCSPESDWTATWICIVISLVLLWVWLAHPLLRELYGF